MNIRKAIYSALRLLVRETQPRNVNLGMVLGLWWGFSPLGSLQSFGLVVLSILLRTNLLVLGISAFFFSGLAYCLDGVAGDVGIAVLTKLTPLEGLFRTLQHAPIIPFTGFNHSVTLGLMLAAAILSYPVYFATNKFFCRYRKTISWRVRESRFFRRISTTPLYQTYRDEKRAWGDEESKYPEGLFRHEGLFPLGLLALLAIPYLFLFMDGQLTRSFEKMATYYNRAPVTIEKLRTHFVGCSLELKNLKVGDPADDTKNLVELDKVKIDLLCSPLLRRKWVVELVTIEGVRYGTQRPITDSEGNSLHTVNSVGLLDRVATGVFKRLGSQIYDNPLRTIGVLTTGIDIPGRIEEYAKKSLAERKLEELKSRVANVRTAWSKEMDTVPSIRLARDAESKIREIAGNRSPASEPSIGELNQVKEELSTQAKSVTNFLERISRDLGSLSAELAKFDGLINEDIVTLRKQFNLPKLEMKDLSPALFGPPLLTYLERLVYWVDVSRRRMPTPAKTGVLAFTTLNSGRGQVVDYFKPSSYPSFVIVNGTIESKAEQGDGYGTVHGLIQNFSAEPVSSNQPARFFMTADFPQKELKDLSFEAIIDHRKEQATETIRVGAGKIPVKNFTLNEGGDASISLEKALISLSTELVLTENDLDGKFQADFNDVTFKADSRFRTIEKTLSDLLSPESRFKLEGNLKGPLDKLELSTSTELGERLATEIRNQFKHQLLAVDDELRKNLLDRVHPVRSEIASQVYELKEKFYNPIQLHLQTLQEMTRYADSEIGRLEARKNPHAKKRG